MYVTSGARKTTPRTQGARPARLLAEEPAGPVPLQRGEGEVPGHEEHGRHDRHVDQQDQHGEEHALVRVEDVPPARGVRHVGDRGVKHDHEKDHHRPQVVEKVQTLPIRSRETQREVAYRCRLASAAWAVEGDPGLPGGLSRRRQVRWPGRGLGAHTRAIISRRAGERYPGAQCLLRLNLRSGSVFAPAQTTNSPTRS